MKTREEKSEELWLHWARMPAWTHHEASALIAGIIPSEKWDHAGLVERYYTFGEDTNILYLNVWDLLARTETINQILFPVKLPDLIKWTDNHRIEISPYFLAALYELHRLPLENQPPKIEAEKDSNPATENLGTRERDTLLYLIGVAAVTKYGFNPKKRNNAATEISKDMENLGLPPLSVDTIRNKLKEASDLIPQSKFSD